MLTEHCCWRPVGLRKATATCRKGGPLSVNEAERETGSQLPSTWSKEPYMKTKLASYLRTSAVAETAAAAASSGRRSTESSASSATATARASSEGHDQCRRCRALGNFSAGPVSHLSGSTAGQSGRSPQASCLPRNAVSPGPTTSCFSGITKRQWPAQLFGLCQRHTQRAHD